MNKPRLPIFPRILLATLLPLILVFAVIVLAIGRIAFQSSADQARERAALLAKQVSDRVANAIDGAFGLSGLLSRSLALVEGPEERARANAEELTRAILRVNPEVYASWFCFEPGRFGNAGRFGHLYRRAGDDAVGGATPYLPKRMGADAAPDWYGVPFRTGMPYANNADYHVSPSGEPRRYVSAVSHPVLKDGEVIGCAGVDMLYENASGLIDGLPERDEGSILVIAEDGAILHSSGKVRPHRRFTELPFAPALKRQLELAIRAGKPFAGEGRSPLSGAQSLIGIHPVAVENASPRLYVYSDIPVSSVYRRANDIVRITALAGIAGLLLTSASLFFATHSIVRPIRTLAAKADLIANGRLDVDFDVDENRPPRHEADQLEISVKRMHEQLTQTHRLKVLAMEAEYEREKTEEASAAKNRFFANMSHELRTPMNAILGMSEILSAESLTDRQRKYVNDIRISSESLVDIVNDILDLSRMESGKFALVKIHYSFEELLDNIRSLCRFLAERKGLEFRLEKYGDIPKYLYGDDVRLRQVLVNLLSNAIKFTERGFVALRVADEGDSLRFEVADTGMGIREGDLEHIFQPFKQVDSRKNRFVKGTGLGLSICLNLVELMGGGLEVDSMYGAGTTFRLRVPKVPGDEHEAGACADDLPERYRPEARVLVVDDSEVNLKVAAGLLGLFGITADTAASGAEALDRLANAAYDLVFMDHMMPELDGVEATKRIRALGGGPAQVPIIALTANAIVGSRELFLNSGMNDFLAKPIEKRKLQAILARWMPRDKHVTHRAGTTVILQMGRRLAAAKEAARNQAEPETKDGPALTGVLRRASELAWLDVPLGLERTANQHDLYEKLLGMLRDALRRTAAAAETAVAEKDGATLGKEAHRIKGTLLSVGAAELAKTAGRLESLAACDVDSAMALAPDFIARLVRCAGELEPVLREAKPAAEAGDAAEAPAKVLPELRAALENIDYDASQAGVRKLSAMHFDGTTGQLVAAMREALDAFNYDAALERLREAFPEYGGDGEARC